MAVVAAEVSEAGLGDLEVLLRCVLGCSLGDIFGAAMGLAVDVSLDVGVGLLNVTGDVEGVAGSLGDGKTV